METLIEKIIEEKNSLKNEIENLKNEIESLKSALDFKKDENDTYVHVDNLVESYSAFSARISAISSTSCSQSSSVPSVCRKPVPISLTKACPMSI